MILDEARAFGKRLQLAVKLDMAESTPNRIPPLSRVGF